VCHEIIKILLNMTSRTVFKIFGSFGPGGSFVTLVEKLCKGLFNEAYELGDPS
jgi:hypothetical protein